MNKILIGATILIITAVMSPLTVLGAEDTLIRNSLKQFFAMLQTGNVNNIESAIGKDLLKETKVLLRENKEYGNFLKQYYHEAEFQVDKIVKVPDGAVVDVRVIFSNKDIQQFQFVLSKEQKDEKSDGIWKIVAQKPFLTDNTVFTDIDNQ